MFLHDTVNALIRIYMHKNESFIQNSSWARIPCMKLCTARGQKKSSQGHKFPFHAWKYHFHAREIHGSDLL